jgi:two-component system cell cycle sensor histidine kinase/response regulator CckA
MTTEHTPMVGAQELAAALDEILIFVALLARDGAIIWANRVALTLGGCTLAEVVGCPLPCAPWWATGAAARAVLPGALAGATAGEVARVELELGQPDERPRRYELTLRLLREVPARSGMILVKGVDVTEARQRETLREREEATYRAVVDAQTDIISRIAADGTILFVNDAYCQFFGRARAALVGRSWHPLAHPDDIVEIERELARMSPGEPVVIIENRVRDAEGRFRWVEFVNRGFYDTDGRLAELQSIGRDITLRKEGEVERRRAERRMQERQRLEGLGLLAGGVAHDFNNVLTCVMASVGLAREELASPEQVSSLLDEIEMAAGRAAQLCRQMLAYAGRSPLARGRIDLGRLVTTSQPLLRASLTCGAQLTLHLAPGVHEVVGDETQLRQILLNLVVNAGEALGERGHEVAISIRRSRVECGRFEGAALNVDMPDAEVVVLAVSDDGVGMSMEVVSRVFEPFFTTKATGRGLGLAATLGLLYAHGAAVRVDSTPGEGTRFEVVFPAAGEDEHAEAPSGEPSTRAPRFRGHGVLLLVDDDDSVRQVLARQLTGMGYQVIEARGGVEGVELFRRLAAQVRVVLLDVTMPDMNGDRVLREIQSVRRDVPALVMGGYSSRDVRELFADCSVVGFLQKPFGVEVLQGFLAEIAARSSLPDR